MEVPLKTIKCGKFWKTHPGCFLSCEDTTSSLQFVWRSLHGEDEQSVSFQCKDISAVDLRVRTKFGSIDAMRGIIIVECLSSILVQEVGDPKFYMNNVSSASKNFIIQATFHVNETGAVRDIIRKLQSSSSTPAKTDQNKHENDSCSLKLLNTSTTNFQEGLPDWVGFIPHVLYSRRVRQFVELGIFLYVVFSVAWALWQLYSHVDFVSELVRPLIDMLKCQYHLLDHTVYFFNTIFEEYTTKWLCFIKPLHTITTTIASPLWRTLGQLSPIFHTVFQGLTVIWHVLWPVAKPMFSLIYQLVQFIFTTVHQLKKFVSRFWSPVHHISVPVVISAQFNSVKRMLGIVYHGLGQARHLDPLKAQFTLVRSIVINSGKSLGLGVFRLMKQIYKIIWLRRLARGPKED